jgi:hypothetical protein
MKTKIVMLILFVVGFVTGIIVGATVNIMEHNSIIAATFNIDKLPAGEADSARVYTFPLTYGELVPLAKDILSDGFISIREGIVFANLVEKVQYERSKTRTSEKDMRLTAAKEWWTNKLSEEAQ